jgi:hypothetical protein
MITEVPEKHTKKGGALEAHNFQPIGKPAWDFEYASWLHYDFHTSQPKPTSMLESEIYWSQWRVTRSGTLSTKAND